MNNSDFSRLLATNDKALITELNKAPAKKRNRPDRKGKGKDGKGKRGGDSDDENPRKGKGKGKGKGATQTPKPESQYRDRAIDRREGKAEYAQVAAEWESLNSEEVTVQDSKYLGGDMEHTHLVKGLDFALLSKVRGEISKQKKVEEIQDARAKAKNKKRTFETVLAKQVWKTVVDTLHPHHATFSQRMDNMGKALSLGQRIRGATSTFLPGRMAFEFDTGMESGPQDIPRIVYMSKEDAPKVKDTNRVAALMPESVTRVRDSIQRAIEARKRRKLEQASGGGAEASRAVAQKVATKHVAKDKGCDIFGEVGSYADTVNEMLQAAKEKARRSAKAGEPTRSTYFDDAGSEKYKKGKDSQINPEDMVVEEKEGEIAVDDSKPAFEAVERFQGPRAGWVFKLGTQGLGYYREKEVSSSASALAASKEGHKSLRSARAAARSDAPAEDDAYGECFPESSMGGAKMTTMDEDSDEEDGAKKKLKKGEESSIDASAYGKKGVPIDPKNKKLNEGQQWQKIEKMIQKGGNKSLGELEAMRPGGGKSAPKPRELF